MATSELTRSTHSTKTASNRLLLRHRLMEPIRSLQSGVCWIWGRSGSGKTQLASAVFEMFSGPRAWVSLDERSADPAYFIENLSRSLRPVSSQPRTSFSRDNVGNHQAYINHLAATLDAGLSENALLIFDDAQHATDLVDATVQALLDQSSCLVVCVCSHDSVPAGLTRFAADNRLLEVSGAQLDFSLDETAAVLNGVAVTDTNSVHSIHYATGGWPLAVRAMADVDRNAGVDADAVATMLQQTVLHDCDEALQKSLCTAAWFPLINERLLNTIAGDGSLEQHLDQLAERGAFVTRFRGAHEDDGVAYQLHPMLADALRRMHSRQMATNPGSGERRDAVRDAAQLAEQLDRPDAAVDLWLEACNFGRAAELIAQSASQLIKNGRALTVQQWIERTPENVRDQYPWLWFWLGVAVLPADQDAARENLTKAHAIFLQDGDTLGEFLSISQIIATFFLSFTSAGLAHQWLGKLHQLKPARFEAIENDEVRAGIALGIWYGLFLVEPEHPRLGYWQKQLSAFVTSNIDPTLRVRIAMLLQKHYYYNGDVPGINKLLDQLSGIDEDQLQPYGQLVLRMVRLQYAWCNGDWDLLEESLQAGQKLSDEFAIPTLLNHMRYHGAAGYLLKGDLHRAADILESAPPGAYPAKHMENWHGYLVSAWLATLRGEQTSAYQHARNCEEAGLRLGGATPAAIGVVAQAYCSLLCGDTHELPALIHKLYSESARINNPLLSFHAALIESSLVCEQDKSLAVKTLKSALAIGRKQQLLHFWFALPQVLTPLCRFALEANIEEDYVRQLISARSLTLVDDIGHSDTWSWQLHLRVFGGFEISRGNRKTAEVLQLTKGARALVSLLCVHGTKGCTCDAIADALWPDTDIDKALHNLETSLYRLRKDIGKSSVVVTKGRIFLNTDIVWSDVRYAEALCRKIEQGIRQFAPKEQILALADQLRETYRGELLPDESGFFDIVAARSYWSQKCHTTLEKAAQYIEIERTSQTHTSTVTDEQTEWTNGDVFKRH